MTDHTQEEDVTQALRVINYDEDDQTWTVLGGVRIEATNDICVLSTRDNSRLINDGKIVSSSTGSNSAAVHFGGDGANIKNYGTITASRAALDFAFATDINVSNKGTIHGGSVAVLLSQAEDGGTFVNKGTIEGNGAFFIFTGFDLITEIANFGSGIIQTTGDDAAIRVEAGGLNLENAGRINGDVECNSSSQADAIFNSGRIAGVVFLGDGADKFTNDGDGTSGKVWGETGDDKFIGGSGVDKFDGGLGIDRLTGNGGRDQFYFDNFSVDAITDFKPDADTMWFDNNLFTELGDEGTLAAQKFHIGAAAHDASDRLIYNPDTGVLTYDSDGDGGSGIIAQIAVLKKDLDLHHTDFIVFAG